MATSEEFVQSILTRVQTIKNHPYFDQPVINDLLSEVDEKMDDVIDELAYLDEEDE